MKTSNSLRSGLAAIALTCFLGVPRIFGAVNATVQPQAAGVPAGGNQNFVAQVSATGGETITGYAWRFSTNNQPPFNLIAGATNAALALTNLQLAQAGYYFVTVTYNSGTNIGATAASAAAILTVQDAAHITVHPQPLLLPTGTNAVFSVTALGQPPLT